MDFLKLAKDRYSCRAFSDKKVEQTLIEKIVDAAILAPTAVNKQPYKIWFLDSVEAKEKLKEVTPYTFDANVFLILGSQKESAWIRSYDKKNFSDVDAAIVGTHIMLETHNLGLGTTWVGSFDSLKLKTIYPQMRNYELLAIFPIGYPAEHAVPSLKHNERKEKSEILEIL